MTDANHIIDPALSAAAEADGGHPTKLQKDSLADVEGSLLYDVLYDLCQDNIEFFSHDDSMNGSKIHAAFLTLSLHIGFAKKKVTEIQSFAHEYDYDEHTKGNGYRSFVIVVDCCIKHSIKLCRNVVENRSSLLFRKSVYFKEVIGKGADPISLTIEIK